jgi:hypothetical protein
MSYSELYSTALMGWCLLEIRSNFHNSLYACALIQVLVITVLSSEDDPSGKMASSFHDSSQATIPLSRLLLGKMLTHGWLNFPAIGLARTTIPADRAV